MAATARLPALLLAALAWLLLGSAYPTDNAGDERILSFLSDVQIGRDASLDVTETIRIRAAGIQFRHGLLREFPTRYTKDGRKVRVGFEIVSVERDGQQEPWKTESMD